MINQVPVWVHIAFITSILFSLYYFFISNGKPWKIIGIVIGYGVIQSVLALGGFFLDSEAIPPRFLFVLVPIMVFISIGLSSKGMSWALESRNLKISTFIHTVRIPVEIVLHQLFIAGMAPQLMTFEGRNFDILIGITAPIVGYLYLKEKVRKKFMIGWNIAGLFFVMFIVVNAVLSIDTPIQQFGFDQPNKAVLYFPYVLLPAIIVPIVIYTHVTDLVKLSKS